MHPQLQASLAASDYTVAFTGAGVSTLSGLPDFRGSKGLYSNPDNMKIFDIEEFHSNPAFYYKACRQLLYGTHDVSASLIHQRLASLEREGQLKAIITQNIDLLHQKAGSQRVIEVHGSPLVHTCTSCGATSTYELVKARVTAGDIPPHCSCGGVFKPDITFFGEALPQQAFAQARQEALRADLMLVLGTSLTVYPAASLPQLCHQRGGRLIIVNDQETELDPAATLRLWSLEEAFA